MDVIAVDAVLMSVKILLYEGRLEVYESVAGTHSFADTPSCLRRHVREFIDPARARDTYNLYYKHVPRSANCAIKITGWVRCDAESRPIFAYRAIQRKNRSLSRWTYDIRNRREITDILPTHKHFTKMTLLWKILQTWLVVSQSPSDCSLSQVRVLLIF
jgi:hypothetical protein